MAKRKQERELKDVIAEIIENINVKAEYESWGVKFAAEEPSSDGWLKCYSMTRDENNPSAGVNIGNGSERGAYNDFADTYHTFFYAAAAFGGYVDNMDAVEKYAEKLGIDFKVKNNKKDKEKKFAEEVSMIIWKEWIPVFAHRFAEKNKPIAPDALERFGARRALWDKHKVGGQRQHLIVFPVYGPKMLDGDPTAYVLMGINGRPLECRVKDKSGAWTTEQRRKHTIQGGTGGYMNDFGLRHLRDAEIVWKVAGPTDCLALETMIPEELRGKHVAITGSGGEGQGLNVEFLEWFRDKDVRVVQDRDKTGVNGAVKWCATATRVAKSVRNVELPYEYTENHGKDLRDYFTDGHTYADLLALSEQSPPMTGEQAESAMAAELSKEEQILERIQLDVLGEYDDHSVRVFSRHHRKLDVIRDVDRIGKSKLAQLCGPPALEAVREKDDDDDDSDAADKYSMIQIKDAIGVTAGKRRLSDCSLLGQGIWPVVQGHKSVIVNGNTVGVMNGKPTIERFHSPIYEDVLLDFSNEEPWCNFELVENYIAKCDREFAKKAIGDSVALFGKWFWRYQVEDPILVTGLIMSTFIQTFLAWRPQVAVMGSSNCGKTIFFETIAKIFGPLALMGEKPSEAGLRQAVRNDSRAIILDEFEHDHNRQRVIELIRTSSRGSSGGVLRGTSDQKGKKFSLRHVCWVAAIEIGLRREPDRNRFVMLEMTKPPMDRAGKLELPSSDELQDLGLRLLAVALKYAWKSVQIIEDLQKSSYGGIPSRIILSYSAPFGMILSAYDTDVEKGRDWLMSALSKRDFEAARTTDDDDLLETLMGSIVPIGGGKNFSVSEILFGDAKTSHDAVAALERSGIKRVSRRSSNEKFIFIYPELAQRHLLRGTKWDDQQIGQILKRIMRVETDNARISGKTRRGIFIPEAAISKEESTSTASEAMDEL